MSSIRIPTTSLSASSLQSDLTLIKKVDESGSDTFVGEAAPGSADSSAVWRISRITATGSDLVILWADGNSNFDNVWNNRASLSYSQEFYAKSKRNKK